MYYIYFSILYDFCQFKQQRNNYIKALECPSSWLFHTPVEYDNELLIVCVITLDTYL